MADIHAQKQLNEKLERVTAELQLTQRISKIGNWFFDPAVGIPQWSDEIFRIYERDPALGPIPLADYPNNYSPEYFEIFHSAISAAIENGTPYNIELQLRLPSGSKKWIHAICEPLHEKGSAGHCLLGTIQDITEKKKTEEALRESEQRYRRIMANAQDMIYRMSIPEGRYEFVNEAALKITGYGPETFKKRPFLIREVLHPDWYSFFEAKWENLLAGRIDPAYEYQIIHAQNGEERWLHQRNVLICDESGKPVALEGIVNDITERKKAEEALRESEDFLNRTGDMAQVGGWEVDLETQKVIWTLTTGRIHELPDGYFPDLEEAIGFYHPEDQDHVRQCVQRAIEDAEPFDFTVRLITAKGRERWVRALGQPIFDSGHCIRLSGTFQDITESKQAENTLRNLENRYRSLVDHSPVCHKLIDLDFNLQYMSANGFRMLKLEENDECYGKPYPFDFFPKSAREMLIEALSTVKASGKIMNFESQTNDAEGNAIWLHHNIIPVFGDDNIINFITVVSADITERKRAEEGLRESEERFSKIFEMSLDLICIADINTTSFQTVNPSFKRVLGYEEDELIGRSFLEFIHPEDVDKTKTIVETHLKKGLLVIEFENRYRHKKGFYLTLEWVSHPLLEKGVTYAIARDITARKQAEEGLRESEERLQILFEKAADAIYLCNENGRFLQINEQASLSTGFSRNEMLNMHVYEIDTKTNPAELNSFFQSLSPDNPITIESYHRRKDGTVFPVEVTIALLEMRKGKRFLGMARDISERKQAEESLKESEFRFRQTLENLPGGVFAHDMEGRIILVNKASCKNTGYSRDQLLSMSVSDIDPASITRDDRTKLWHTLKKGESITIESTHRRKDDSLYPAEIHLNAVTYDNQPIILAYAFDISERLEREKFKSKIIETSIDGFWLVNSEGRLLEANPAAARMLGYSLTEMQNLKISDIDFHEEYETTKKRIEILKDKGYGLFESQHLRKDGKVIDVEISTSYMPFGKGCFIAFIRDITKRKQVEKSLRESEERFSLVMEATQDGLWDWNLVTGTVFWSPRSYTMLGYEPNEFPVTYEIWQTLIHPDDVPICVPIIQDSIQSGESFTIEFRYKQKDGSWLWIMGRGRCLEQDNDGKPLRMLGTHTDISESKRANEERERLSTQLQQAQKMESVGRLAGGVAHDFNNMLGVIIGHLDMILMQIEQDHLFYDDLMEIKKAGARSADLTRQLLAFARKQTVAPKMIDLDKTVEGMLKMLQRLIGEDIDMAWIPGNNLWPVKIDPGQIDQILANLCVNARDAITGVGKVTIETGNAFFDEDYCKVHAGFETGEYVMLAVSDNGCGMDSETLVKVFEPFFTTKEVGKGTGLGLATVYGVVKQNNGFINAYSELGQGTTFKIYLPRYNTKAALLPDKGPDTPSQKGCETVLLVEDEPSILKMTTKMLKQQGYTVVGASTPGEAIRLQRNMQAISTSS